MTNVNSCRASFLDSGQQISLGSIRILAELLGSFACAFCESLMSMFLFQISLLFVSIDLTKLGPKGYTHPRYSSLSSKVIAALKKRIEAGRDTES